MRLIGPPVVGIDKRDAARFAGLWINQDFARRGIRSQREVPGVHRRVDQPGWGIERGMDVAASCTPAARPPAETAIAVSVVLQSVSGDAGAVRRQDAIHLLQ